MSKMVNVAYCVNRKMLHPLCVSIYSAAANVEEGRIWVLHSDLSPPDQEQVRHTVASFPDVQVQFLSIETDVFKSFEGLHGEVIPFSKLLLPRVVDEVERLVYLDADTVVIDGLSDLYAHSLEGCTIGAVSYEPLSRFLEREYFGAEGLDLEAPGFNSGVLLIDVETWNRQNMTPALVARAQKANPRYGVFDQPILNVAFHQDFCPLRIRYNKRAGPDTRLEQQHATDGILHFVGIPKPWDVGGRWFHKNHHLYEKYRQQAGVLEQSVYEKIRSKGVKYISKILWGELRTSLNSFRALCQQ